MTQLPASFLKRPIAHRALHDRTLGRIENSMAAVKAAIDAGYGIEIDVQLSRDGAAMVFHDYDMARLTGQPGAIQTRTVADLAETRLTDGVDAIHTLPQILDVIAGQVPLVIEIKDQDGEMGHKVGPLETAVADALRSYKGDVAVMSFNPNAVSSFASHGLAIPLGYVTDPYAPEDWPTIPAARRAELAKLPKMAGTEIAFISHQQTDLASPAVAAFKNTGRSVLCWTIRSQVDADHALKVADNITFEGFLP